MDKTKYALWCLLALFVIILLYGIALTVMPSGIVASPMIPVGGGISGRMIGRFG